MLAPALASCVARLVMHEGFADVSFRLGGRRGTYAIVLGLVLPLLVGGLAYGTAHLTGLAGFAPSLPPFLALSAGPLVRFAAMLALAATAGTVILLPSAAGEEIGWRGYLLPRLIQAGAPSPVLLSGRIWGSWHLVPDVFRNYAAGPSPLFSATNVLVTRTTFGAILAWMRLATGSIWPCIVAHAAWNAMINRAFDRATVDTHPARARPP
jgi:uncharacterized protein